MNDIISLIAKYPHLIVCFFLSAFIAITQNYYGRKAYYLKNEKYRKQYRIVNKITVVVLLITITAVLFMSPPLGVGSACVGDKSKAPALQQ